VLTVEVTDANAHTVQKSYAVEARERCWLAFVASEPAPAHVALVDGRLVERQPSARRTLPEGPRSDPVVDFQFSPDGRFIAYRLGAGPALRLELARLSNGRSQAITTDGSVSAYAWSSDASTLAIAVDAGGQSFLGGIDVSAVRAVSFDPDLPLDGVRALDPVAAPRPDSALAWYAENRLAFLASAAGAERRLVTAALERERFAPPLQRGGFSGAARLSAGAGGVFVAEPATGLHEFFADGVGPSTLHAEGSVLAASGAYAGLARDGTVQIFRPERASSPEGSPSLAASGCSTLLAWADEPERIACASATGAEARVAWFEISAAGDAITALGSLAGALPGAQQAGQRRAFSARGRWYAFTTGDGVSVARVQPGAPRLQLALPASVVSGTPSVLSFSPDESFLAVGAANTLGLIDLEQGAASYVMLSPSAVFNELCSERFVDGATQWCGSASREPDVSWSGGSDLIAFRSTLGTLQLIDLSRASEGHIGAPLSPDACFEGCSASNSARFQP
jgi:WD40 repeat protein